MVIVDQGLPLSVILNNGKKYKDELLIINDSIIELEETQIQLSQIIDIRVIKNERFNTGIKLLKGGSITAIVGAAISGIGTLVMFSSSDFEAQIGGLITLLAGEVIAGTGAVILTPGLIILNKGVPHKRRNGWIYSVKTTANK